jgi:hypothetical protein
MIHSWNPGKAAYKGEAESRKMWEVVVLLTSSGFKNHLDCGALAAIWLIPLQGGGGSPDLPSESVSCYLQREQNIIVKPLHLGRKQSEIGDARDFSSD